MFLTEYKLVRSVFVFVFFLWLIVTYEWKNQSLCSDLYRYSENTSHLTSFTYFLVIFEQGNW